ncbi:hypothetical protein MTO96_013578 [Rhipicephalus appendiculatus]
MPSDTFAKSSRLVCLSISAKRTPHNLYLLDKPLLPSQFKASAFLMRAFVRFKAETKSRSFISHQCSWTVGKMPSWVLATSRDELVEAVFLYRPPAALAGTLPLSLTPNPEALWRPSRDRPRPRGRASSGQLARHFAARRPIDAA